MFMLKAILKQEITGKYKGSAQTDCNINIKLNHKMSFSFPQLKKLCFTSYYTKWIRKMYEL